MNTMTNIFKAKVQDHIINSLSTDETTILVDQLQTVVNEFNKWYSPYEQKRTPNKQQAFTEFLNCLPSCINQEWEYSGITNTMKSWFGSDYSDPKSNSKEAEAYLHLIHREFKTLCKKNNVKF
jgi:hypothetical protein